MADTQNIRAAYRIVGNFPEIADERLEEDFVDPYQGIFRKKGDFKYSDKDLERLYNIEKGENIITTGMYNMRTDAGDDPMVAMSRAQLAGFLPGLGSAVAQEDFKTSGKSFLDNYQSGNKLGMGLDAAMGGLSLLDAIAVNAPLYFPVKKGATSLLEFAANAIRRKR